MKALPVSNTFIKASGLLAVVQLSLTLALGYAVYQLIQTPVASSVTVSSVAVGTETSGTDISAGNVQLSRTQINSRPAEPDFSLLRLPEPDGHTAYMQRENILARPLFNSSRQPEQLADNLYEDTEEVDTDWHGGWQLTGIIRSHRLQIALFGNAGQQRRLQPGMQLEGWQLGHIADDHVVMQQGENRIELPLITPSRHSEPYEG